MWRPIVTTVVPTAEPLSTAEAKQHLRVGSDDEDDLITGYVRSARSHVEGVTGTRLVTQTVRVAATDWCDLEDLPVAPVQSITSITYTDTDGVVQTLATDVVERRLDGLEPSVILAYGKAWPTARPGSLITVTAVVGYGAPAALPGQIMHAIRLMVGDFYAFRESAQVGSVAGTIPSAAAVDALLANHRKHLI